MVGSSCVVAWLVTVQAWGGSAVQQATAQAPASQWRSAGDAELLVSELLRRPSDGAQAGQPLTLLDAVRYAPDAARRAEVVRAYWNLSAAVALAAIAADEAADLKELSAMLPGAAAGQRVEGAAELRAALSAANAAARTAAAQISEAQQALARLLPAASSARPPWPVDVPHVDTYHTRFEAIYAGRAAPPRAWLLHKVLPWQLEAIHLRAQAVRAAADVVEAAADEGSQESMALDALIAGHQALGRAQRALVASVRRYNDFTAQYALPLADLTNSPEELVGMLIHPARELDPQVQPAGAWEADGRAPPADPAHFDAPLDERRGNQDRSQHAWEADDPHDRDPAVDDPAAADPRAIEQRALDDENQAATAVPHDATDGSDGRASAARQRRSSEPVAAEPSAEPGQNAGPNRRPAEPPAPRTARKPDAEAGQRAITATTYGELVELAPPRRSQRLARQLVETAGLPAEPGTPLALEECLARGGPQARRAVVAAYWPLCRAVGCYQAWRRHLAWIESVRQSLLEARGTAGGAQAMLAWRVAELSARAEVFEHEVALREAQLALAETARLSAMLSAQQLGRLPLPATAPHGGRYDTRFSTQPERIRTQQELAATVEQIAALERLAQDQATAVLSADWARVESAGRFLAGRQPLETLLATLERQTEATLAYLDTLTEYNIAIGGYAAAVLPVAAPETRFVQALVVNGSARR